VPHSLHLHTKWFRYNHVFDPAVDIHKRSTYVLMVYPTVSRTKVNIVKAFTCSERNSHLATLC